MGGAGTVDVVTFWAIVGVIGGCLSWLGTALFFAVQRIATLEGRMSKCTCSECADSAAQG